LCELEEPELWRMGDKRKSREREGGETWIFSTFGLFGHCNFDL